MPELPNRLTPVPAAHTLRRQMLNQRILYDFHVSMGGKLVDFAGGRCPSFIAASSTSTSRRNSGSIFDVSHMGRLQFSGKDTTNFLSYVLHAQHH